MVDMSGEVLWDANLSGTLPHTPTIGDVDGDGQVRFILTLILMGICSDDSSDYGGYSDHDYYPLLSLSFSFSLPPPHSPSLSLSQTYTVGHSHSGCLCRRHLSPLDSPRRHRYNTLLSLICSVLFSLASAPAAAIIILI